MTPEEFYYIDKLNNRNDILLEIRIRSFGWVLDCFRNGKIRKQTITNFIARIQLDELMEYLLDKERYEDCAIVRDILTEIYDGKTQKQIQ